MTDYLLLLSQEPEDLTERVHEAGITPLPAGFTRRAPAAVRSRDAGTPETAPDTAAWRGLAAFVLLADTLGPGELSLHTFAAGVSPLADAILEQTSSQKLQLVLWSLDGQDAVLGIADPHRVIRAAAQEPVLNGLLPREVVWADGGVPGDPVPFLDSRQRALLIRRLGFFDAPEAAAFREELLAREAALVHSALEGDDASAWRTRMEAVICLHSRPEFDALTFADRPFIPGRNALLDGLGISETRQAPGEARTWLWRGVPIAVSSGSIGLEPPVAARETEDALAELKEELDLLRRLSRAFPAGAADSLSAWQDTHRDCLTQEAAQAVSAWASDWRDTSLLPRELPVLSCPLDAMSPALQASLREALGDELARVAFHLFSDTLTLFPHSLLGDTMLDAVFALHTDAGSRSILPPLSDRAAEYVARHGCTGDGFQPALSRVSLLPGGAVEVAFALKGQQTISFTRVYSPDQQLLVEEVPSISLWPCRAFHPDHWHLYCLSVTGDVTLRLLRRGSWEAFESPAGGERPAVIRAEHCPYAVSVSKNGRHLGAVLNITEPVTDTPDGELTGAIDATGSEIHLAVCADGTGEPFSLASLWRVLLRNQPTYEGEPLPVFDVGPELPASVLMTEPCEDPFPWQDGRLAEDPQSLPRLLYHQDTPSRCARKLMLEECLTLLSLAAALRNADHLTARLVLPDSLLAMDAQRLAEEFAGIAASLSRETGMPIQLKLPTGSRLNCAVRFLRIPYPNQAFAMLHLGGAASGLAIWLRGMERPALVRDLPGGVTTLLARCSAACPGLLRDAFSPPAVGEAGSSFELLMQQAVDFSVQSAEHPSHMEHLQQTLDLLIARHGGALRNRIKAAGQNAPGAVVESLLLYSLSLRFAVMGLAIEKLRWDSALSIHLPAHLPLVLCDLGVPLFAGLDAASVWQLNSFLQVAMGEGNPVASCPVFLSPEPGREAALGLAIATAPLPGASVGVLDGVEPPNQLASRFLLFFKQAFPAAADVLLPGLFTADGLPVPSILSYLAESAAHRSDSDAAFFIKILEQLVLDLMKTRQ
ncbi:MAG: hypothetical protein IKH77_01055 [Clostridia bacterium]|nr:hypothetical protein [Clostridia bacterium]